MVGDKGGNSWFGVPIWRELRGGAVEWSGRRVKRGGQARSTGGTRGWRRRVDRAWGHARIRREARGADAHIER